MRHNPPPECKLQGGLRRTCWVELGFCSWAALLATPKEPRPGRCAGYGLDRAAAGTTVRGAGLLLSAVALPGRGRLGGRRRRALLTRHGFVLLRSEERRVGEERRSRG